MTTARNFLRAETLHTANDAASNATAELAMFDQYDIDGIKHSSSDGQRIETQVPTINARHGSKYFGLKKGVSAYSRTPTSTHTAGQERSRITNIASFLSPALLGGESSQGSR
jgi:TnpA family transposase